MLAALMLWLPAEAQLHRGARTIVRGGMFVKPDSLRHKSDSLANNALARELDSLMALDFTADSLAVTALRTDDIRATDSLMQLRLAGIKTEPDSMRHKKGWLMSDSMSLSKVCWISTVLPGYGQIYNKQYWKLPILYGTVGAGLALYINENRTYKPLKREYDAYTDKNLTRTPELDALQAKMIRSNTRRQVYLGLTVASYAYAYHRQHGIELTEAPIPLATDTIRIDRLMHLGQIASTIDIPIETLRQLNPQYKLDIIPATTKPYTLVLPQRNITQYIANEPAIFAKDSAYLKEYINPANIDKKRQERSGTVYVVKKGDTLGAIARRYRVTTAQLMRWNGIKNAHKLRLGQRIRIEGR